MSQLGYIREVVSHASFPHAVTNPPLCLLFGGNGDNLGLVAAPKLLLAWASCAHGASAPLRGCAQPHFCCKCQWKCNSSSYFPRGRLLLLSMSLQLLSECRFLLLVWIKAEVWATSSAPEPTLACQSGDWFPWDTEEGIVPARGSKALWWGHVLDQSVFGRPTGCCYPNSSLPCSETFTKLDHFDTKDCH